MNRCAEYDTTPNQAMKRTALAERPACRVCATRQPPPRVLPKILSAALILGLFVIGPTPRAASETLTVEPSGQAYNFVMHYRIVIEAPARDVWAVLIDFDSWMYEFELSAVSGTPGTPGQVLRLYEGQDFLIQVTSVEQSRMLSIVNLPLALNGEFSTGAGVFTLHEAGEVTEVSLTMSRRYAPSGEGFSELRETRQSREFQASTRAMWQDRFLVRLKAIAEGLRTDGDL